MQFKITTDYAIRTVLYLATKNEITTSGEISQVMGIPQKYLIKLLGELRQHKLVRVHMGVKGGYTLNKNPQDISLLDIVEITESTVKINRCLEPDCYCSREGAECCPVRKYYTVIRNHLENSLSKITIQDLVEGKNVDL